MRRVKWILPFLLLFAAFGCSDAPTVRFSRTKPAHTAVSLSPSSTELAVLSFTLTLKGRTESCDYPTSVSSVPVVMKGTKPDFEAIAQIKPDIVFYDMHLTGADDVAKMKQMGLNPVGTGGDTLDEFIRNLFIGASAAGAETNVNDYVNNQIRKELVSAQTSLKGRNLSVALIMPGNGSEHMIAGVKTFQADLLKQIGQKPVGPDTNTFVNLNAEDLIKENPDVILVAGDLKAVAKDPRLQQTKAFKSGQVYGLQPDLVLREGARVDQLIADMAGALGRSK